MIKREHLTLTEQSVAVFSGCERYRYYLSRTWDASADDPVLNNGRSDKKIITYLMLNPSTADERINDPTIERCQRRAIQYGYGKMVIVNLFPIRMTDSTLLDTVDDLYGDIYKANEIIINAVHDSDITVCGWGNHPLATDRARHVFCLLDGLGLSHKLFALDVNSDGSPRHPLYISYKKEPKQWAAR